MWSCKCASFYLYHSEIKLFHNRFFLKTINLYFSSFLYFERINKMDTMDWKIDKYRLLTTFFFIDCHRFPINSTDFYRFYRILLILSIGQAEAISKLKVLRLSSTSVCSWHPNFWAFFSLISYKKGSLFYKKRCVSMYAKWLFPVSNFIHVLSFL